MSGLFNDSQSAGMSEMKILIVNEAERASIRLYNKLQRSAKNIPVYQDRFETPRNKTIWKLLGGGKDDFYIYDRCGRLAYYVPYPISFLYRPYAQAAILSTYFGEPCGPCPTTSPETVTCNINDSNCTTDGLLSETNVTDAALNVTTLSELNVTTLASDNNQTLSTTLTPLYLTTNTSKVTDSGHKRKFNPVIEELKGRFGHKQTKTPKHQFKHHHHNHSSPSDNGHTRRRNFGFRYSHRHSKATISITRGRYNHRWHNRNASETKILTTSASPPVITQPILYNITTKTSAVDHINHTGHKHHHQHEHHNLNTSEEENGTLAEHGNSQHLNLSVDEHGDHLNNSGNLDQFLNNDNTSVNSTSKEEEILTSDRFYKKFYPDYEMILNLALVDWLNKSIPNQTNVTTTTAATTTATTTKPKANFSISGLSNRDHLSTLLENLKKIKQRQRSELIH